LDEQQKSDSGNDQQQQQQQKLRRSKRIEDNSLRNVQQFPNQQQSRDTLKLKLARSNFVKRARIDIQNK
jgi:hypothetical protein